jgi:phage gpG-like protein
MSFSKKGDFKFDKMKNDVSAFKRRVVKIVANEAKNHFLEGFEKGGNRGGGMTDASRGGWVPRKAQTSERDLTRAILVDKGNLHRDIAVRENTFAKTVINVIHIPYAIYHNEGISGRLPKREFIGKSTELEKKILVIVENELKKVGK